MTLPVTADLTAYRGDDFSHQFHVVSNGVDEDISCWTITAKIRRSADEAEIDELTVAIDDGPGGLFTISFTEAETAALAGRYVYDVESDDGSCLIRTLASGRLTVTKDVTY